MKKNHDFATSLVLEYDQRFCQPILLCKNTKCHPKDVVSHEVLPFPRKWEEITLNHNIPVGFSILRPTGPQKPLRFAGVSYAFAARGKRSYIQRDFKNFRILSINASFSRKSTGTVKKNWCGDFLVRIALLCKK